ncbi:uncharacterized protein METZ01_LOCUS64932 [marine metagenome]|uniref:Uncharacterized protein n=1 Tax=marine metagenome TaxID=408172 RepID=A0A381T916_9ZZZZ
MIKSIIFDFDGVLVDSEILVAKAFSRYMIESGYDFNHKEFSKFAGKKTFEVISHLSDKFSIEDEEEFYDKISIKTNFQNLKEKKHFKLFLIYLTNFLLMMKRNFIMIS